MKKNILIIISICIYSIILSLSIDTIARFVLVSSGTTLDTNIARTDGFRCMVIYKDKNSAINPDSGKPVKITAFENKVSATCPKIPPTVELTKQELLKIIEDKYDEPGSNHIILKPNFNLLPIAQ